MKKAYRILPIALSGILFCTLICIASELWACPNCKNSVARNSAGMSLGFAWSIGLLLAVPLTIVSAWAVAIRRYCRQLATGRPQ
jgi:hypothetical protein